jgi:hypothetical protein
MITVVVTATTAMLLLSVLNCMTIVHQLCLQLAVNYKLREALHR